MAQLTVHRQLVGPGPARRRRAEPGDQEPRGVGQGGHAGRKARVRVPGRAHARGQGLRHPTRARRPGVAGAVRGPAPGPPRQRRGVWGGRGPGAAPGNGGCGRQWVVLSSSAPRLWDTGAGGGSARASNLG